MSNKPIYKYQVVSRWGINTQGEDGEDIYKDTLEGALAQAKKDVLEDGKVHYVTKVIFEIAPEKKDIKVTVKEIKEDSNE